MRIEIACTGGYRINSFIDELDDIYDCIQDTIDELGNIYNNVTKVNCGLNDNLEDACNNINNRINEEKGKRDSISQIRKQTQLFYDTTIKIDKQVARQVDDNSELFFSTYAGLGNVSVVEKSWWDEFVDGWGNFWEGVGDALQSAWNGVCDFFTEYALEMIVGTIGFVVGGIILVYGAGVAFVTVLVTALVAIGAVVLEASIMALIEYINGGNFWEAFKENFASGFMFAGIFFAIQSIVTAVSKLIQAKKAAKVMDKADDIVDNIDDIADKTDDIVDKTDDVANTVDDVATGNNNFRDQELLDSHYERHRSDFGNITKEEYLQGANDLINSTSDDVLIKRRANGDIIYYNPITNEFVIQSADGYIRTYFKPTGGIDYFNRQ